MGTVGLSESCLQRWLKIADRGDGLALPASGDRVGSSKGEAAELLGLSPSSAASGLSAECRRTGLHRSKV